jgi:hypothetical protein
MMIGPMALMLITIHIFFRGVGWITPADYVYLGVLAGLILARWLEFSGGNPLTSNGEPATWTDFRHYVGGVVVVGVAVWVLANAVGNHGLD